MSIEPFPFKPVCAVSISETKHPISLVCLLLSGPFQGASNQLQIHLSAQLLSVPILCQISAPNPDIALWQRASIGAI